jgi:hypothetical protein
LVSVLELTKRIGVTYITTALPNFINTITLPNSINTDAIYQLFTLYPQFGIILYKQCQFVVVLSQITTHLRVHHPDQIQLQRDKIQRELQEADRVASEKH